VECGTGLPIGFGSTIGVGRAGRAAVRGLVAGFRALAGAAFLAVTVFRAVAVFLAAGRAVRRVPVLALLAAVVLFLAVVLGLDTLVVAPDLVREEAAARRVVVDLDLVDVLFLAPVVRFAAVLRDLLAVVRVAAGFADCRVLAAVVSALAAVFIALVAVAIERMAVDMVLAEAVALVAAVVTLVAADDTLVAAEDTLVAAVAGVDEFRRAVVAVRRVPALLLAAVVRLAEVVRLAAGFLAAGLRTVVRTVVRAEPDRAAADVLVVRLLLVVDLVRPVLAELRRAAAVRVAVFVGTDLSPRSDQLRGDLFHR
jgi:hypothetical protein